MNIEENLFKKTNINFEKLILYGFTKQEDYYVYHKNFLNDEFKAEIIISKKGEVKGKIYDLSFGDEYLNYKIESQTGEFVNKVRASYKSILEDIIKNCCTIKFFINDQSNRITNKIIEYYHDNPEFLWEKTPDCAVFRNPSNKKWYGLVMNIPYQKINNKEGNTDILNVKLDSNEIKELLNKKGYYPAYHMNKKYWITISLDDTISDEEIFLLIIKSHKYTETTNEWIVPANPKFYDITDYKEGEVIYWKQSSNIEPNDIVLIYLGSPYSCILYKCLVLKINIPSNYHDKNLDITNTMELKILKKFSEEDFSFAKLNKLGLKVIRGPRHIPEALSKELN